jgi:hypothetical protein
MQKRFSALGLGTFSRNGKLILMILQIWDVGILDTVGPVAKVWFVTKKNAVTAHLIVRKTKPTESQ